jgi:hypothetical protein
VKAGQFLGAQTFVFGQYMFLSKETVRIDARVVHTATGEVILTRQITGRYDGDPAKFLDLEKQLVLAIADGIDQIAGKGGVTQSIRGQAEAYLNQKAATIDKRKGYVEGRFLAAEALEAEDRGDYGAAKAAWKKVLAADPQHEVALARVEVLAEGS